MHIQSSERNWNRKTKSFWMFKYAKCENCKNNKI